MRTFTFLFEVYFEYLNRDVNAQILSVTEYFYFYFCPKIRVLLPPLCKRKKERCEMISDIQIPGHFLGDRQFELKLVEIKTKTSQRQISKMHLSNKLMLRMKQPKQSTTIYDHFQWGPDSATLILCEKLLTIIYIFVLLFFLGIMIEIRDEMLDEGWESLWAFPAKCRQTRCRRDAKIHKNMQNSNRGMQNDARPSQKDAKYNTAWLSRS